MLKPTQEGEASRRSLAYSQYMQCPKCEAAVGSSDMVSFMDCTSFLCSACKADLQVTAISQCVIGTVGILAAAPVHLGLLLLGVGPLLALVGDTISIVTVCYLGFAHFSGLEPRQPDHPSLLE